MHRRPLSILQVSALGAMLVALCAVSPAGTATAAVSRLDVEFRGVTALSPTEAWMVGTASGGIGQPTVAMARHWDGSRWTNIPAAQPGDDSVLYGVSAVSPDDVWAVGQVTTGASSLPLVEHWDGQSWQVVTFNGPMNGQLNAVAANGPDDVWMVGVGHPGPLAHPRALIAHWDGERVRRVPAATLTGGRNSELDGVVVAGADEVWAVGARGRGDSVQAPLAERFDGTSWTAVKLPALHGRLEAVSADDQGNLWAVGGYVPSADSAIASLVLHWDGSAWSQVTSPAPGFGSELSGVAVGGPTLVWAVGWWAPHDDRSASHPLVERWDGTRWHQVRIPNPRPGYSGLDAVATTGPDDAHAVGTREAYARFVQLTYRWDGTGWLRS